MLIHDCEQGTPEWDNLRASRPTSSEFSSLVTGEGKPSTSLKKYALKLATEKFLGGPIDDGFQGNKFTDRGHELEDTARANYEMENQIRVQNVGFCTDDLMRYGSSTDGFIGDDGIFETKNLISTVMFETMVYLKRNDGKLPPKYRPQLEGELLVTERKWVDLVLFNPAFEMITIRVYPDPAYQELLKKQITACILERDKLFEIVNGEK